MLLEALLIVVCLMIVAMIVFGCPKGDGATQKEGYCRREVDRHGGGYLMEPHSRDGRMFTPGEYPCKAPCVTDYTVYPAHYPRNLREMGPREWFREPVAEPWKSWWQWEPRGQADRDIFKFGYGLD